MFDIKFDIALYVDNAWIEVGVYGYSTMSTDLQHLAHIPTQTWLCIHRDATPNEMISTKGIQEACIMQHGIWWM